MLVKSLQVSSKKSSCQQPSLERDGSCLGVGGPWTPLKNSRAPKAGSPASVALSQPCRNNHDYRTEIHYNHQECLKEYPVENYLHRKCNNTVISPAKQRSLHHVKQAQEMDQKANEFQSTCPQQVSHGCACRHVGSSGSVEESHCVSQVHGKHSGPVHKTCDDSRHSQGSGLNHDADSGPKETMLAKTLHEERRQKLLLQKMELEIEKEQLQHLLTKQEAKLLLKQQQLHQSCMDYNRIRGPVPGLEDVPVAEAPGGLALMMNGNSMGLSVPVLKHEDYLLRTPPINKNSRTPGSSRGSSSGKKMVGFGANMDDGQTLLMQTKREGTKSRKGTTSGPRKDAATSPGLMGRSKARATTVISPIQHDTSRGYGAYFWVIAYWKKIVKDGKRVAKSVAMLESREGRRKTLRYQLRPMDPDPVDIMHLDLPRYEACLLDLVEGMSPISAPGQLCRESPGRNKMRTPHHAGHRLSSSWYQSPCSSRSRAEEMEESRLLEEIFFI
ncbi:protein hinderin [Willisornis vidua]|uniref:Protein hinderin n=1 Tax=Willisornis vidua TaxID=1566151 RepID=A0ABQ9CX81_9PASS|nr:protein hinderin [Willisornis vidua]